MLYVHVITILLYSVHNIYTLVITISDLSWYEVKNTVVIPLICVPLKLEKISDNLLPLLKPL